MCELCWQPRGYTSMTIYIHLRIAISTLLWNQWTLKVWQASGTGAVESARERRGRLLSKHFFSSERGRRFVCPAFLFLLFDSFFFFMLGETDAPSSVYREEGRYSFLPTNDDIPPIRLHPINPPPVSYFDLFLFSWPFSFFLSFSLAHRRRRRLTRTHQLSPPIRAIHLADIFRVRRDGCHGSRRANEKMKRHKEKKKKKTETIPSGFFFIVFGNIQNVNFLKK